MLHAKISVSLQVNRLSLPAQLLFTWMIAHADDEGRLKGDSESIKALVVPMKRWSFKKIKIYLESIKKEGLIYYWQENNEWFVEFVKWSDHQYIQKDRFKASTLPKYNKDCVSNLDTNRIQADNSTSPQAKSSETKLKEIKISEANKQTKSKKSKGFTNPKTFQSTSEGEVAAWQTWNKLEPNNPMAFQVTYLTALNKGLPPSMFYQFASEIKQDDTIRNPGAVFNDKVRDYLEGKEKQP